MNAPAPKKGLFVMPDGKNLAVTFFLVASLFMLWGFCNGMIDTMDKHFQDQLNLTKAQSAWVQFAHYIGYALMALPAGLITLRLGYKGGIILGLLLVAFGGFWFLPATSISQFWAFLLGVCLIAMGLTVLETVANPYTTVLGPKEYGPTRINLAQSFNGIGWIFGPIVGGLYFYSEGGVEKAHGQLFVPYLGVAIVVLILAVLFFKSNVPDIKVEDEYHTDDPTATEPAVAKHSPLLVFLMMFLNVAVVGLSLFLVLYTILPELQTGADAQAAMVKRIEQVYSWRIGIAVLLAAPLVFWIVKRLTTRSIWAHPHFSGATIAQFFYVAAQAGIFSFFINTMTVDKNNGYSMIPELPSTWSSGTLKRWNWIETRTAISPSEVKDFPALAAWLKTPADPVSTFLNAQIARDFPVTLAQLNAYTPGSAVPTDLKDKLVRSLNEVIRQELNKKSGKPALYDVERFRGITIGAEAQQLLTKAEKNDHDKLRLNRLLLQAVQPTVLPYHDAILAVADKGASNLSSLAFVCFLLGRIFGAWLLKRWSAHKALALYALLNVGVCALIIANLGWVSVLCVFVSYFFMSIMFPTIFAVGIHGLGTQSKKKAAAFIVMSITGGALMPKLMGQLGDVYTMAHSFYIPLGCFVLIAVYGVLWSKLSQSQGVLGLKAGGGH